MAPKGAATIPENLPQTYMTVTDRQSSPRAVAALIRSLSDVSQHRKHVRSKGRCEKEGVASVDGEWVGWGGGRKKGREEAISPGLPYIPICALTFGHLKSILDFHY